MNGDTKVDVKSEGRHHLELALKIANIYHTDRHASDDADITHFYIDDGQMILFRAGTKTPEGPQDGTGQVQPLPYKMSFRTLTEFILGWLSRAAYPQQPDIDGSTAKGWRLHNQWTSYRDWSQVCTILPDWREYHK